MIRSLIAALFLPLAACATVPEEPPPPPHAAFAWATFDERGTLASGASGMADRAAGRALTLEDPVRIASISKLVVALGIMRLVEQGKLDLDSDVSDLLGWRLRNPAFPDTPITLRLLLSHRSSLQDEVDYVVPLGVELRERASDPKAFDTAHAPGTYFRYSNLGFPVIASVMEAATGERFDRLMKRLAIDPLGLEACFNWTMCSPQAIDRAVVLYTPECEVLRDDLKGEMPACAVVPAADGSCNLAAYRLASNGALFSPQGGLRASVSDMQKIGRLLLRKGRLPAGTRFLSEASIAQMTRPAWRFDGSNGATEGGFYCAYGLAVQILAACAPGDDPIGGGTRALGHAGDAYRVRSGLWIDESRERGIAYFATGIAEDAPRGRSAYRTIEEWLAAKLERR